MKPFPKYRVDSLRFPKLIESLIVIFAAITLMIGCENETKSNISTNTVDDALMKLKGRTFEELVFIGVFAFSMGDDCVRGISSINEADSGDSATPCTEDKNDALSIQLVSMKDFSIQTHEVSYQDFDIYTKLTGKEQIAKQLMNTPHRQAKHPVTFITWKQSRSYCQWLGKQIGYSMDLPSEAQWESAARNGKSNVAYATNSGKIDFGVNISYPKNNKHPMQVGSWAPSPAGIYDMTGNVDEWTLDLWHRYTTNPSYNPSYVEKSNQPNEHHRVTRGSGITDNVEQLKLYRRVKRDPDKKYPSVGFRCVVNHDRLVVNKEETEIKSDLFTLIDLIQKNKNTRIGLVPVTKSRILYELTTAPYVPQETDSEDPAFDQFEQREAAAITIITIDIESIDDWNVTISIIGELHNEKMIPEPALRSFSKAKSIRIKENTDWLHNNLLRDKEDWDKVITHLAILRSNITKQKHETEKN